MATKIAELLAELVRIDSCNPGPLGQSSSPATSEEQLAAFLTDQLRGLGFAVEAKEAAPHRPNLVAFKEMAPGQDVLAFEAHMDTVGVDGMAIDPFEPRIADGRLYGRGSCDMKAGMAAMLVALESLVEERVPLNVMFIASCAEETGCEGAHHIDFGGNRPTGVIVGEPTRNRLVVAHKTHVAFRLATQGRAAHGSHPEAGSNAVYKMMDVCDFLRRDVIPELAAEMAPGFDGSTLSLGTIEGGTRANIVPDRCVALFDLRLVPLPGRSWRPALEALISRIESATGISVDLEWTHASPGLAMSATAPLVQAVQTALTSTGGDAGTATVNYCTDAGVFADHGIPSVVCGPGDILQAHSNNEYVELRQLDQAVEIYIAVAHELARAGA